MTETLHTCPDCGQSGFSARGLKAHQGNATCQKRAGKAAELEVIPPKSSRKAKAESGATLAVMPQVAPLETSLQPSTAEGLAESIKADIARYERTSREAAFIALRIGLRLVWVRDNQPYGTLAQFIGAHFENKAERTLRRYISCTDTFLQEAGMLDKKTHRLTGKAWSATAPIVEEQLDLFTDPAAKHDGAMKKLIKWVGERGLADIYKELEERRKEGRPPPKPTKDSAANRLANQQDEVLQAQLMQKHAAEQLAELETMLHGESWKVSPPEDLAHWETTTRKLLDSIIATIAARKS